MSVPVSCGLALSLALLSAIASAQSECHTTSKVIQLEEPARAQHYFTVKLQRGVLYLSGADVVDFWKGMGEPEVAETIKKTLPLQENMALSEVLNPRYLGQLSADLVEAGRAAVSLNETFLNEVEMERLAPPCNFTRKFHSTGSDRELLFSYTDFYL